MNNHLRALLRNPHLTGLRDAAFLLRGLLFVGRRYQCPCCGWHLRAFVAKGAILLKSKNGYCPRCNAKARHRRLCLYLQDNSDLMSAPTTLLEVAPWWSLFRFFRRMRDLRFVGLDLERAGSQVTVVGDTMALPFGNATFDALLCIHVLEHVIHDRRAMAELHRVLRPGGWAIVSVPLRPDRPTHEDPSITDPAERARVFGERGHVRFYGGDFPQRLRAVGFDVAMDPAKSVPPEVRRRCGLRDDENLFRCRKPAGAGARVS